MFCPLWRRHDVHGSSARMESIGLNIPVTMSLTFSRWFNFQFTFLDSIFFLFIFPPSLAYLGSVVVPRYPLSLAGCWLRPGPAWNNYGIQCPVFHPAATRRAEHAAPSASPKQEMGPALQQRGKMWDVHLASIISLPVFIHLSSLVETTRWHPLAKINKKVK